MTIIARNEKIKAIIVVKPPGSAITGFPFLWASTVVIPEAKLDLITNGNMIKEMTIDNTNPASASNKE